MRVGGSFKSDSCQNLYLIIWIFDARRKQQLLLQYLHLDYFNYFNLASRGILMNICERHGVSGLSRYYTIYFSLRVHCELGHRVELLIHLIMGNFGLTFQIKVVSVCAELDIRGHKGGPCLVLPRSNCVTKRLMRREEISTELSS